MVNYTIKQIISYVVPSAVSVGVFFYSLVFAHFDLITSTILGLITILLSAFIGIQIIKEPFTEMLKGGGVLVFDISSPGFIQPYVAQVKLPYLNIKTKQGWFQSVYNRTIGNYFKTPKKMVIEENFDEKTGEKKMQFTVNEEEFTNNNFALGNKPLFLWNSKINAFLTKEMVGNMETTLMTEHLALVTLEQQKKLSDDIKNLTRSVVDHFAPSAFGELIQNPVFRILVIVVVIILLILLLGPQLPKIFGYADTATQMAGGLINR